MKQVFKCDHLPNFDKLSNAELQAALLVMMTETHGEVEAFCCSDCKKKYIELAQKRRGIRF